VWLTYEKYANSQVKDRVPPEPSFLAEDILSEMGDRIIDGVKRNYNFLVVDHASPPFFGADFVFTHLFCNDGAWANLPSSTDLLFFALKIYYL